MLKVTKRYKSESSAGRCSVHFMQHEISSLFSCISFSGNMPPHDSLDTLSRTHSERTRKAIY